MRELAEEASPEQRVHLQGLWRQLTLNPEKRLKTAFFAHPNPARDLSSPEKMDARALLRRFRFAQAPAEFPESLEEGSPPEVADLVLLPPLRPSVARRRLDGGGEPWPDVDPLEDVLLML